MGISPKTRFEVFKRDNFTCRYCGRKTPNVVLEIDHVIPKSQGGTDELENLVTSCWECNRGKGKTLVSEVAEVASPHDRAVLLLELERQLQEYNTVKARVRHRENEDIRMLLAYWDELAFGAARKFPSEVSLRMFLRYIPREDIMDAMEIAMESQGDWRGVKYLYGILHNWRKQRKYQRPDEGRNGGQLEDEDGNE